MPSTLGGVCAQLPVSGAAQTPLGGQALPSAHLSLGRHLIPCAAALADNRVAESLWPSPCGLLLPTPPGGFYSTTPATQAKDSRILGFG